MELINLTVQHKSFGIGTITEVGNSSISVSFKDKVRKFAYPDVFATKLIAEDPSVQEEILKEINSPTTKITPPSKYIDEESEEYEKATSLENFVEKESKKLQDLCNKMPTLSKASRCLNLLALQNELPTTFCRDKEIEGIMEILLRRFKANVLLTGPSGVGKTAVAEGLAQRLVQLKMDKYLYDKRQPCYYAFSSMVIFELSLNSLVAGTKYRGEFEEKLQNVLDEVKEHNNVVIYIDEIHQAYSAGRAEGCSSFSDILKPALARNELRVIGSTTTEESKYIHQDKALSRRFTEIVIKPLSGSDAIMCLEQVLPEYERYYHIKADKSITASVLLSKVNYFMPDTVFPSNVIDIIDQSFASAKYRGQKEISMYDINQTLSKSTGYIII